MKVLIVEPGKHPYEKEIDSCLESLQKNVGGYIEAIYPFEDLVALVCDEEAKLKSDTQWNRILGRDVIKGTFSFAASREKNSPICPMTSWRSIKNTSGSRSCLFLPPTDCCRLF